MKKLTTLLQHQPLLLIILAGGILIGLNLIVFVGLPFAQKKANEFKTVNNPEKAKEVSRSLKETVSKIYVLPPEDPTVATVTDKFNLPPDSFYKNAENGDKLLFFPNSQKVVLYRPSINKVVDVGFLAPTNPTPQQDVAGERTMTVPITASNSSVIQTQPKTLRINP